MSRWNNKIVIFDLDGTIADISVRRNLATKDEGRMNWTIFQDPNNIGYDVPNQKVVDMLSKDKKSFTQAVQAIQRANR